MFDMFVCVLYNGHFEYPSKSGFWRHHTYLKFIELIGGQKEIHDSKPCHSWISFQRLDMAGSLRCQGFVGFMSQKSGSPNVFFPMGKYHITISARNRMVHQAIVMITTANLAIVMCFLPCDPEANRDAGEPDPFVDTLAHPEIRSDQMKV